MTEGDIGLSDACLPNSAFADGPEAPSDLSLPFRPAAQHNVGLIESN